MYVIVIIEKNIKIIIKYINIKYKITIYLIFKNDR
jgi:hypothetical protein